VLLSRKGRHGGDRKQQPGRSSGKVKNPNAESDLFARLKETNRILSLRPSSGLPTFMLSLRLCFGDALPLPLEHHLALELGHRGEHVEH